MQKTEIKCDGCGKIDINYTANCEGWFLQLANVSCAPWYAKEGMSAGMVTAAVLCPPIERTAHFCGVGCLAKWLSDNHTTPPLGR